MPGRTAPPVPVRSRLTGPLSSRAGRPSAVEPVPETRDPLDVMILMRDEFAWPALSGDTLQLGAERLELTGLLALLKELTEEPVLRAVTGVDPRTLRALEERATKASGRTRTSLSCVWRLRARSEEHAAYFLKVARDVPEVARVWAPLEAREAAVSPGDDPFAGGSGPPPALTTSTQDYLDASPWGVDARAAWALGLDGAGIQVASLEQGWQASHPDLPVAPGDPGVLLVGDNGAPAVVDGWHCIADLGIVAASDNSIGCIGVAPGASLKVLSAYNAATGTKDNISNAIATALMTLSPGDVILIELDRAGYPVEVDASDFLAIQLATDLGVAVIEPAGNGGRDLDQYPDPVDPTLRPLNRAGPGFRDSGAIMVGASGLGGTLASPKHFYVPQTNYGSRLDVFAWGYNVVTTGFTSSVADRLTPANPADGDYRRDFDGTSSASAIIAGVAALVQQRAVVSNGSLLSPSTLRARLSDQATGQEASPTGAITYLLGVMPDLGRVLPAVSSGPDIFVRDNLSDDGSVPSAGALSISPDVIVVAGAALSQPDAQALYGAGSGTENSLTLGASVQSGADHAVYVRLKNRGGADATGCKATVYWAPASTLVSPNLWTKIDMSDPVDVPASGALTVTAGIPWPSAALPAPGHYCFVAVAEHAADPAPPLAALSTWDNFTAMIRAQNNVAWRNFNVISGAQARSGLPFFIVGAPDQARRFDFVIRARIPEGMQLALTVPAAFARREKTFAKLWGTQAGRKEITVLLPRRSTLNLKGVPLDAGAQIPARFSLVGAGKSRRSVAQISITQHDEGLAVGGLTWLIRG